MMLNPARWIVVSTCCILLGPIGGCASPGGLNGGHFTAGVSDVEQLSHVLHDRVPEGTKAADAVKFMQNEGFACKWESNSTFRYKTIDPDGKSTDHELTGVDYWRCRREKIEGWVTTVMTVAMVIKDDQVADVIVDRDFIGP